MLSKYYTKRNIDIAKFMARIHNIHSESVKSNLEELIETTKNLCNRLDEIAKEELKFCEELGSDLERMSWEMTKFTSDLQSIKEHVG